MMNPHSDIRNKFYGIQSFKKLLHKISLAPSKVPDLPEDFDADFYGKYYDDLRNIRGHQELSRHYVNHGSKEGRFHNAIAVQNAFAHLPSDFDVENYRRHNADVRNLSNDEARLHYISTGRFFGKVYRSDQIPGFDPEHFRETHPAFACADDETCHDAWQEEGGPDGPPGTEGEQLRRLGFKLTSYPSAFPWRFYTRLYPRAAAHRWAALSHFVVEGFEEIGEQLPYGDGAPSFLTAVGDLLVERHPQHPAAVKAYELAVAFEGSPSPGARRRLAEAYDRMGAWSIALDHYERILADGAGDETVLRSYVKAAAARAAWPRLFERLPKALVPFGEARDTLAREATETYFAERSRKARMFYADGRRAEGDAVLAEAVRGVADLTAACLPIGTRTGSDRPFAAILADGLPEGAQRRLDRRVAHLGRIGLDVRVFDLGAVRAFEAALPAATFAILVRMPAWPTVVQALVCAKRLGVPTVYETDELTVDPRFAPPPLAAYEGRIGERAHEELIFGVALYGAAARLCDYGLAPNRALAAHLGGGVRSGRSFVVRDAATPAARSGETSERVRLFLHAPRSHVVRVTDGAGAALLDVLRREPQVALTITGHVTLDDAFAAFADRIGQRGPGRDWEEALGASDLNLVLADESEAASCLAVTGWLAAARFGIPTLASRTRAYTESLQDGIDVRLASGETEWRTALAALIANAEDRQVLGGAAARRAASAYSDDAAVEDCRAMVSHLRNQRSR